MNRKAWTREFIEDMIRTPPSDKYLDALIQVTLSTPTNAAAMMMANLYFLGPIDLRPAVNALDRPALFVYSSFEWSVATAEEVRKGWPEMPVKVVDTQSHALFVAKPQEFNRVLEEFLASLPK